MTATIVRFPPRRAAAIFISSGGDGDPWLVLAPNGHDWLHGDRASALDDAEWLGRNTSLPVREVTARAS